MVVCNVQRLPNYSRFTKVFLRIRDLGVRVLALALLWPQDVEYSPSYHPILRDTPKGNTQETAGSAIVICLKAKIFYQMSAMKIR